MKHLNKIIIGILGLIVVLSLVAITFISSYKPSSQQTAIIKVNGEVFKTIDLSALASPMTFTVDNGHGGFNTIQAENGKIAIIEANCPDQLCVELGYITNSLLPAVCLPNGLVVEIQDNAPTGNLDAIVE